MSKVKDNGTVRYGQKHGNPGLKDRVTHPKFGTGEVVAISGSDSRLKCVVRFEPQEGETEPKERKLLWFVASAIGAKVYEKHTVLPEEAQPALEDEDLDDETEDELPDELSDVEDKEE